MLVALATAPFGRMGAVEAKAMPNHPAMAGHCAGQPKPDQDRHEGPAAIDCMIACATIAPAAAPDFVPPSAGHAEPVAPPSASILAGIRPEAEPPPPRFS